MFDTPVNTNNVPVCLILGKQRSSGATAEDEKETPFQELPDKSKENSQHDRLLDLIIDKLAKNTKALHKLRQYYF